MSRLGLPKLVLFVFVLSAVLSVGADALEQQRYLPSGSVSVAELIGPPPAVGSAEFNEQMAVVMWMQRTRTPEQIAFVQEPLDLARFAPILAESLLSVDGIALKRLLDDSIDEVRQDYDSLKAVFDLPRPFEVNDAVHPAVEPRQVASYPSGHAIRSIVYARLLSAIFPQHGDALMKLAYQIGYGRVIAGVHYPGDVLAGQAAGNAYADAILAGAAFEMEVARIRGKQPADN
jgi:acid phosphatase (class A)